jgi:hypothetical protein
MAIGIEPQAMAKGCPTTELFFGYAFDEINETAVSPYELSANIGERESSLLFRHGSIEGIDPAMRYGVSRRFSTLENSWQVLERLLLPRRYVSQDVPHRPITGYAGLHQLRI